MSVYYEYLLLNKPKRTRSSPAFTAVAASLSFSYSTYAQPLDLPDLCVTIRISRIVPNVANISLKSNYHSLFSWRYTRFLIFGLENCHIFHTVPCESTLFDNVYIVQK